MSSELDDPMLLKARGEVAKIYKANEINYLAATRPLNSIQAADAAAAGTLATLRATGLYKG
jgi:hypothetical protein